MLLIGLNQGVMWLKMEYFIPYSLKAKFLKVSQLLLKTSQPKQAAKRPKKTHVPGGTKFNETYPQASEKGR